MKTLMFFMSLLVISLTAPVSESDSDEEAAQPHSSFQMIALYRMYERLLQQGVAAPPPSQFNEFYQRGDAAPLNSDEAEENEEAEVAEGAEGAYGAEGAEGAYGAERAEPAAEELTIDPAAVPTDAPVDHEVPHDYLLASDTPNVEVNVADNFDPVTESSLPYLP